MFYVVKNNSFLARLPGISANSNEIYRPYNFQAFANISGNFRKFSENLQPYTYDLLVWDQSFVMACSHRRQDSFVSSTRRCEQAIR